MILSEQTELPSSTHTHTTIMNGNDFNQLVTCTQKQQIVYFPFSLSISASRSTNNNNNNKVSKRLFRPVHSNVNNYYSYSK